MTDKRQRNKQLADERVTVRFDAPARRRLEKGAKIAGVSTSGFVRAAAEFAAQETIAGRADIAKNKLVQKPA